MSGRRRGRPRGLKVRVCVACGRRVTAPDGQKSKQCECGKTVSMRDNTKRPRRTFTGYLETK